jgi:predicted AAA+ superfamily ATPase
MLRRHLTPALRESLGDSPVTMLVGARQTGKSTLARAFLDEGLVATYLTLDDGATLAAADADPDGFVAGLATPVAIDEVQRVPALLPAIKASVDRDRRPGRFLLTGSANVMLLPRVSESLAGRMETHVLWPLSQGEIEGRPETFLERLFGDGLAGRLADDSDLLDRIARGGFPLAVTRSARRRGTWLDSYVDAVLQREVREIANVDRLASLPRLLALLAARTASLLNTAELARSSGIAQTTLQRYLTLLEHVFLLVRFPAWHANLGKRLVRSPKLHLADSGVACGLLGASAERLGNDPLLTSRLLESFVGMELVKQASWSSRPTRVYHFRTSAGREADFLLELRDGSVAAVEVKAGRTIERRDLAGLRMLVEDLGERFVRGVVLYGGTAVVPFGPRLEAWPMPSLWS